MRTITGLVITMSLWIGAAGCAAYGTDRASGGSEAAYGSSSGSGSLPPGQLTAGAWDDNANFEFYEQYLQFIESKQIEGLPITQHTRRLAQTGAAATALDVAFVLDTTGSMGDELDYITHEVDGIARAITAQYPDLAIRWGGVLYRDDGDQYVTRKFDFTQKVSSFQSWLTQQSSGGGGDFPEAPEKGLAEAAQLAWRSGDGVARIAFWVGDAPHHVGQQGALLDAIRALDAQSVHIYPVSASGTDDLLEYSMRAAAQMTGGRYQFLTDDSGIGGEHKEPTIPCYVVTKWNSQMVRMISMEVSRTHIDPAPAEILRTRGNPKDGQCTLSDGEVVVVL